MKRRNFLKTGILGASTFSIACKATNNNQNDIYERIDQAAARPVLKRSLFKKPVIIESVELLRHRDNFICRVRSKDGAEGLCVSHNFRMKYLHPIAVQRVNPYFIGKDATRLDELMEGVYLHGNNYKLQNMALWIPIATVELAILDMLGRIANLPMGLLMGDLTHEKIHVYRANNFRGLSAKESVEKIKERQKQTGAKAVKFKIGGRMLKAEEPAGRTEKMIPLMREAFSDDIQIYADANGSYNTPEALRIGKILEENKIDLYEGPVPFDWYQDIKKVADHVNIPLAGGGQEASMRNFRWLIANNAFQVYQQDIFYFGGMIRCMKVARMAEAAGLTCMPHISGTGLGYLYMLQFISVTTNAEKFHEFKGLSKGIPFNCDSSSLKSENGLLKVPTGPGSGVEIDPKFVARHKAL